MKMEKSLLAHHKSDVRHGGSNKKQEHGFPAACLKPVEMPMRKAGEMNPAQNSAQVR